MRRPSRVRSQTPSALTTGSGYCANTGARKSGTAPAAAALAALAADDGDGAVMGTRLMRNQVQPGAGAVRPAVSGRPCSRFIHCTAPPAAPLFKLSIAHITATVRPSLTADRRA